MLSHGLEAEQLCCVVRSEENAAGCSGGQGFVEPAVS